jgi:serine/threonine protein kinase
LTDFGSAKKSLEEEALVNKSLCGTPYWMAPEVIKQTGHNRFADIWSLGCAVYEMAAGKPPWSENKHTNVMLKIAQTRKHPPYPRNMSDALKDFLDQCFKILPHDRANVYDLIRHKFVAK